MRLDMRTSIGAGRACRPLCRRVYRPVHRHAHSRVLIHVHSTTVGMNVNLTMAHCFGFFPTLTREWIVYMLVPWLHLVFNLAKWFTVRRLQRLSHSNRAVAAFVDRTASLAWIRLVIIFLVVAPY